VCLTLVDTFRIWEVIADNMKDVPLEEFAKLPKMAPARSIITSTAIPNDESDLRRYVYRVALTNKLDALHEQALALPRSPGSPRITTTEQVITEYLNFFAIYPAPRFTAQNVSWFPSDLQTPCREITHREIDTS
jgi:hypothetical protein